MRWPARWPSSSRRATCRLRRRRSTLPVSEPTTIKGTVPTAGARLYVYRHASAGDERLADGERAAPGDLLQLAYATTAEGFGVLLSIDGAGTVTQHWPEPGRPRAAPVARRR